jgi:hypothetical protein
MTHTLWGDGVLLGEADLGQATIHGPTRLAPFKPTERCLALLPLFAELTAASVAAGPMVERERLTHASGNTDLGVAIHDALHRTPDGRRVIAALNAVKAANLELHDGAGAVVPARHLFVQDKWGNHAREIADLPPDAVAEFEDGARYLLAIVA